MRTACSNNINNNLIIPKSFGLISGYIPITDKDNLFYLLVRSKNTKAPLVVFLNGGPGASSMTGAFVANGPYLLSKPFSHDTKFQLRQNSWSWNKLANVVYLDQPRYVGYSYGNGNYLTSLDEAGHDFIKWLQLFYQRYPQFKQRALYLTGESFAGAYIAEYSHQILEHNKIHPQDCIKLSGIFIQSGVIENNSEYSDTSPLYQLHFLCAQQMLPTSACDSTLQNSLKNTLDLCLADIAKSKHVSLDEVKIIDLYTLGNKNKKCTEYIHEITTQPKTQQYKIPNILTIPRSVRGQIVEEPVDKMEFARDSQIQHYLGYSPCLANVKLECQPSGGFPPCGFDNYKITKFFNTPEIKLWLGNKLIPPTVRWEFAKYLIPLTLIGSKRPIWPIESYYAEALQNNVRIIFAFGKDDWISNYSSAQEITNRITFKAYGKLIFSQLPAPIPSMHKFIMNNNQAVGEYKSLNNITFVQIDDAGHMIGINQPEAVYKLLFLLITK